MYFQLEAPREFRHSSVAGDFRVQLVKDGFCTSWKTVIVGRDTSGRERYRISNFGRRSDVTADGARIVSCNGNKQVAVFDALTGTPLSELVDTEDYLFGISWLPDGSGFLANTTEAVLVFSAAARLERKVDAFAANDPYKFISNVIAAALPNKAYVCNSGAHKLQLIDLASGVCEREADYQHAGPDTGFLAKDGSRLVVTDGRNAWVHTADTLDRLAGFALPGDEGVRQPGEESSSTCWAPLPKLSPNNERMLLNDRSGLLWLLANNGGAYRSFSREDLGYVEDMVWIDNENLVAITNDARVVRSGVAEGAKPEFLGRDLD